MPSSTPSKPCTDSPVRQFTALIRPRLVAAVALTAMAGGALVPGSSPSQLLIAALATSSAAAGCGVLNQLQERQLDRRMLRTRNRPLVSGHLPSSAAIALIIGFWSLSVLLLRSTPVALGLCALAAICYNLLYTPMKVRASLALIPGALCGALPPLIGWYASGGETPSIGLMIYSLLLLLWQIPHFVLLETLHAEDYRSAGLPTLGRLFAGKQLPLFVTLWMAAMAVGTATALALSLFPPLFLIATLIILVIMSGMLLTSRGAIPARILFPLHLLTMLILSVAALTQNYPLTAH